MSHPSANAAGGMPTLSHDEQRERIKRFVRSRGDTLLSDPNITSIGIGYKQKGGQSTGQLALQVTVANKLQPQDLPTIDTQLIPASFEFEGASIPTDVVQRSFKISYVEVELHSKSDRKTRQDPIQPGMSVGHYLSTAGTLGAIVRDRHTHAPLLLSNWHVLNGAKGQPGDVIVQPGPYDDNRIHDNTVGHLLRSHLGLAGDCALASIEQRHYSPELLDMGVSIRAVGKPDLGDLVIKSGRTTNVTYGVVSRVDIVVKMTYPGLEGTRQIGGFEIAPSPLHPAANQEISKAGDSGSSWMATNAKGQATDTMLGLHFGGDADGADGEVALACYAHSVFEKLEIEPCDAGTQTPPPVQVQARASAPSRLSTGFQLGFLNFPVPDPGFQRMVEDDLASAYGDERIDYCHFSVWLSRSRKLPRCVAWNIDGARKLSLSRKGLSFVKDARDGLDAFQIGDELYAGNEIDRGHVARRDDLVWGGREEAQQANRDSFYFSNITPQHQAFNQSALGGKWGQLENALLADVTLEKLRASLMGGPVLGVLDPVYRGVRLPVEFWKVVFFTDVADGQNKARAFLLTQRDLLGQMKTQTLELAAFNWYQVPLKAIEERTGLMFDASLHHIDTRFEQGLEVQARLVVGDRFFD